LPAPDAKGNYPAVEALRVSLARKILRQRRTVGLTQADLARRAKIRPETLNRLEHGKHTPSIATIQKIQRAPETAAKQRGELYLSSPERFLDCTATAKRKGALPLRHTIRGLKICKA
jgi:transcriptional regulator with XRE-family HTH domain